MEFKNSADRWKQTAGLWADEIIKKIDFDFINKFKEKEERLVDSIIEPSKIVGASHANYHSISWREFLTVGQRVLSNIEGLDTNPSYYDDPRSVQFHDGWRIYDVDGQLFIVEGHHRSIIAKFRAHEDRIKHQKVYDLVKINLNRKAIEEEDIIKSLIRGNQKYEINAEEDTQKSSGNIKYYSTSVTLLNVKGYSNKSLKMHEAINIISTTNKNKYRIERTLGPLKKAIRILKP